jgi:hypothetical protein
MRILVVFLVLAAAAKLGWQEYAYRTGLHEAVISANRERAIKSCQRDPRARMLLTTPASLATPSDVHVVLGRPRLEVALWDLGNGLWNARHRHPHLVLIAGEAPGDVRCAFDVVDGTTFFYRG